ncbi:hypothetical protein JUJ52_03335 [Virgibacillus sp. AGTR]|uniref:hypothetical protein n=1 Tax=Virgibacillus sp. AGTR TaxID=2812055 RepID=UPI001D16AD83|nr:hypothetical protein [Virgibacillus sp. AGTR]MCC2248991.1 hypothetical protein [Virgibacillus sp. AGTR]
MTKHDMKGLKNHKVAEEDKGTDEQEKSSFFKWLETLRDKLKLGSHYKMERFTIMLGATLSILLLLSVFSFVAYRDGVAQSVSAKAVYTEDFNFSLSDQKMYVEGVYGNKDKTDVMILLRLQNPETMSTDASNYELFITSEKESLSYEPDVSLSLFGATGYGTIRFQDDEPIPKEVVSITIRAKADLSQQEGSGSSGDDESSDGSFEKYDQGRFYVNPGADDVETLDWLNTGEKDPTKLYTALVADTLDEEIHTKIQEQTDELDILLNREKEYTNRLVSAGYEPPETPWFVKGDYVNDDGVFVAAQNLEGAFAFDYSTKTIRDGYIIQVMDNLSSFDEYMRKHSEHDTTNDRDSSRQEQVELVETIKSKSGEVLDLNTVVTGSSPSAQVAAKDSVESLQATWRSYLNIKSELQRNLMRELLILDADVQSQRSSYSVQSNKDAVTFY